MNDDVNKNRIPPSMHLSQHDLTQGDLSAEQGVKKQQASMCTELLEWRPVHK